MKQKGDLVVLTAKAKGTKMNRHCPKVGRGIIIKVATKALDPSEVDYFVVLWSNGVKSMHYPYELKFPVRAKSSPK